MKTTPNTPAKKATAISTTRRSVPKAVRATGKRLPRLKKEIVPEPAVAPEVPVARYPEQNPYPRLGTYSNIRHYRRIHNRRESRGQLNYSEPSVKGLPYNHILEDGRTEVPAWKSVACRNRIARRAIRRQRWKDQADFDRKQRELHAAQSEALSKIEESEPLEFTGTRKAA